LHRIISDAVSSAAVVLATLSPLPCEMQIEIAEESVN